MAAEIREALLNAAAAATPSPVQVFTPLANLDLDTIITKFDLKYSDKVLDYAKHNGWDPENVRDAEGKCTPREVEMIQQAIPHLARWLYLYDEIAIRSSQVICHMPTHQVLLEALAILGGHSESYTHRKNDQAAQHVVSAPARTIFSRIKLFAERELNISPPKDVDAVVGGATTEADTSITSSTQTIYTGCVDYSIALAEPRDFFVLSPMLLVITAKNRSSFSEARKQLLAYVGCIYNVWSPFIRSPFGNRRMKTSYGAATDGYKWVFLKITHDGNALFTKEMDVRAIGWAPILKTIIAILKQSAQVDRAYRSGYVITDEDGWDSDCVEFGRVAW